METSQMYNTMSREIYDMKVRPLIESIPKKYRGGRPSMDTYYLFNLVLLILSNGSKWDIAQFLIFEGKQSSRANLNKHYLKWCKNHVFSDLFTVILEDITAKKKKHGRKHQINRNSNSSYGGWYINKV